MDEKHREILRRNRANLVKDLEPLKLLNDLGDCLDEDDREEIKALTGRKSQAEELLDMIPRKGPKAFQSFVAALYRRQKHLAEPLIEESGVDVSIFLKDDVGMTSQHKQILCNNVENLQGMNLEKVVPQLHLAGLLDEMDKEDLLSDTKQASHRVDMLLTEILPRKGPSAYESFTQELEKVHPSMALKLLQDAGIKGSSNGDRASTPTSMAVQDTGNFTLDSLVQEILDVKPECLKYFCQSMDEDDVWGNGWKRFYQKLNLPAGMEAKMEGRDGGPTLNCIKGWISLKGRDATVQALLMAANHAERKDCTLYLEKSLGCQLDCVDSPVDDVTRKVESLTAGEDKTVEFFGDLDDKQASQFIDELEQESLNCLRKELLRELHCDDSVATSVLLQQSKKYRIRQFTDSLTDDKLRKNVVRALRDALPTHKGVTGPSLPCNKYIRDVSYTHRSKLTMQLCGDDSWKSLAEKLGMDNTKISYLNGRTDNPADEVLRFWEVKSGSTVGNLYNILLDLGYPYIADLL